MESKSIPQKTHRVGIVGTACRGTDAGRIDSVLFANMVNAALDQIHDVWGLALQDTILVSGGAAGADHVAICLWEELKTHWKGLELYLPCEWDLKANRAVDSDTGRTMNGHHTAFSKCIGRESLSDVARVRPSCSVFDTASNGFLARNTKVAKACDRLIAFTWHDSGTEPKPRSGTADTWNKAGKDCIRVHVPLAALAKRNTAAD